MSRIVFWVRWWRWFFSSPCIGSFSTNGRYDSAGWHRAQNEWLLREPKKGGAA